MQLLLIAATGLAVLAGNVPSLSGSGLHLIQSNNAMQETQMDTSKLNPVVRSAFEAWQGKDLQGWLSHFTPDATLYDDGNPRDFQAFSREIGKERFTSIEKVNDDGTEITGQFHSDQWGNFRTYFRFHLNAAGKIERLDIGQAG